MFVPQFSLGQKVAVFVVFTLSLSVVAIIGAILYGSWLGWSSAYKQTKTQEQPQVEQRPPSCGLRLDLMAEACAPTLQGKKIEVCIKDGGKIVKCVPVEVTK